MSIVLPPDLEEFVRNRVSGGEYPSEGEVIREAFRLLERREELLQQIEIGAQQLENGQFTEYDQASLRAFFDELQAQGRQRYEESRRSKQ